MTGPGLVSMVTAMAEILNSDLASLISATLKMTQEVGVSELESVCVRERVWFNFPSHNCNFDLHFCIFLSQNEIPETSEGHKDNVEEVGDNHVKILLFLSGNVSLSPSLSMCCVLIDAEQCL